MKLGIVIASGEPEAVWNALRLANFSQAMGDKVTVFLIGKGVLLETLDSGVFRVNEQYLTFTGGGGGVLACGTCLDVHKLNPPAGASVATLKDLYQIVKESEKVISF